jgi:glycosyltransferase involved in cell wall biosynthesis
LQSPRLLTVLWREVQRAELVHVHGLVFQGSIVAAVFARSWRRRCLLTDHGGLLRYRSRLGTWALRLLIETAGRLTARCADRSIAINTRIEQLLRRLNGASAEVLCLPNPVSVARFRPPSEAQRQAARAALGWDERPRVLFIGRVLPHKGVEVLLEAAEPPLALVFCGPGDPKLVARIRRAGAEYLAPRPQQQLVALYQAADVFALPSRNEGFPLVVQEALACGLPVVTTAADGYAPYRELTGLYLCEPSASDLRASLRAALANRGEVRPSQLHSHSVDHRAWLARLLGEPGSVPACASSPVDMVAP